MRFFFDNCLPPPLVTAVNAIGATEAPAHVGTHLREKFNPDTPDERWIPALGQEGEWIIVSGDIRITRTPHLRQAWLDSRLTAFFLAKGWTNLRRWDFAWKFLRVWPNIASQAGLVKPPAGFLVPINSLQLEQLPLER